MAKLSRYSWIPNAITGSRFVFALALLFGGVLLTLSPEEPRAAPALFGVLMVVCFLLGALSDMLDGWAARSLQAESEFGARLDLSADKAFTLAALYLAAAASSFAPIVVAACSVIVLRDWWVDQLVTKVRSMRGFRLTGLAKMKAVLLFSALGFLLLGLRPWPAILSALSDGHWTYDVGGFLPGVTLLWCAVFLALLTCWQYFRAERVTSGGV